jgi:CBS domain-containing protein
MLSPSPTDAEDTWINRWQDVQVVNLIDSPIVAVDADTTVEDACEILLKQDILCLAVKNHSNEFIGLFDVRASQLVTLPLNLVYSLPTSTRFWPSPRQDTPFSQKTYAITFASIRLYPLQKPAESPFSSLAVSFHVLSDAPVDESLNEDLSEKNPLQVLPDTANILDLLKLFSLGTHRGLLHYFSLTPSWTRSQVLIKSTSEYLGIVSDTQLLSWFAAYAKETPSFHQYSSKPLNSYALPSLNLHTAVVAATSNETVLDAMRLMSEDGVSSIAVLDEESGNLLSAVSVTDIGRVCCVFPFLVQSHVDTLSSISGRRTVREQANSEHAIASVCHSDQGPLWFNRWCW